MNSNPRDRSRTADGADERRRHHDERVASIESSVLLGADGRVHIRHRGQTYELRETRFGKLILTK